ncbi:DUF1428 domain-containing protein [Pyruvatibacter mobilis]|uniref:DUF1428 domain-containing protein n=1 Tax=Pyruvatibacter mobilis TaxID=1712261 RepID=UPI003BAF0332
MSYVDGFVIAVPTAKKDAYLEMARAVAPVFRKHGATSVVECWGEDVPQGELTSFPLAVKATPDEGVVFSWIVWPDKATRDKGNAKAIAELEEAGGMMPDDTPFDTRRMIMGGFDMVVDQ